MTIGIEVKSGERIVDCGMRVRNLLQILAQTRFFEPIGNFPNIFQVEVYAIGRAQFNSDIRLQF